ncbi:helix-turn-helix domain-containing protein [Marinoscillum furvescens]|uniref:HTH cro/C1-type domain-containing protein n=1 Tax=Marinoscillum furvescens DSM 4134 TaxID=1122208 RepID=A0A3D9L1B7_MARFU|nr:helix-turn-helix transcriptional regulator [Marinoscillum furvescens]RED97535.1 hypothetical protein C7460_112146 [Marinoscillum furvescens DSM 4134]
MDINDRISQLITNLQMNPNSFADNIGVKSPVIYNIIKGRRSKPSFEVLQKILIAFETINANWLLKGEGEVWRNNEQSVALDKGYETIEEKIISLVESLRVELGANPSLEELSELIHTLLAENMKQKEKIAALYTKQDKILEVLRDKLSLDL